MQERSVQAEPAAGTLPVAASADVSALWQAAYPDLKRLAHARLAGNRRNLTMLDTSALINECFLKLEQSAGPPAESRGQFFAYASRVMRSVIVDTIRARRADRRGGGLTLVTLDTLVAGSIAEDEPLQVDDALRALEQLEPRLAQVVEMRYFGGMTEVEIAAALDLTERTVRRDWEKARALLRSMLSQ